MEVFVEKSFLLLFSLRLFRGLAKGESARVVARCRGDSKGVAELLWSELLSAA